MDSPKRGAAWEKEFEAAAEDLSFERPNVDAAIEEIPKALAMLKEGKEIDKDTLDTLRDTLRLAEAEIGKDDKAMIKMKDTLKAQAMKIRKRASEQREMREQHMQMSKDTGAAMRNHASDMVQKDLFLKMKEERENYKEQVHSLRAELRTEKQNTKSLNMEIKNLKMEMSRKDKAAKAALQKKFGAKEERMLNRLESLERDNKQAAAEIEASKQQLEKQRAAIRKERNAIREEKKMLTTARQSHGSDKYGLAEQQRRIKKEEDRLKKWEHRLELEKRKAEHERVQIEQKKLAMEHNSDMHASHNDMITKLKNQLNRAEGRIKVLEIQSRRGKVVTKIIEKIKYFPEWIEKNGWERSKAQSRVDELIKQAESEADKVPVDENAYQPMDQSEDKVDGGDVQDKLAEQMRLNSMLHEELERLHEDHRHLQNGLTENMSVLEKNEDKLVGHAHEVLQALEEASLSALADANPEAKPERLLNQSDRKIKDLLAHIDEKMSRGQAETKSEGTDSEILNQVHMKPEIKFIIEELLTKVGRLLLGMNQQIVHSINADPTAKGKPKTLVMAHPDAGDDAIKLARIQKEYHKLKLENTSQADAIGLLKQQCHEQSVRHAQLHKELEGVLRLFLRAQMEAKKRGAPPPKTTYQVKEVPEVYKDPNAMMPAYSLPEDKEVA